jgi:hypothetical protein
MDDLDKWFVDNLLNYIKQTVCEEFPPGVLEMLDFVKDYSDRVADGCEWKGLKDGPHYRRLSKWIQECLEKGDESLETVGE